MSLQSVRQFLADHAPDIEIIELNQSTADCRTGSQSAQRRGQGR
ncbi:tRNA proofreading protein [Salmonella enterica subsp. enterica]|uniref:tRNA proofreading protein n=1 Tax=Salmonella enterica I TaxID=59201 RepID=A0A3S4LQQ2_SALET|nr:tRNA proofreading protein [Salmonella enterica subsp. enterica]